MAAAAARGQPLDIGKGILACQYPRADPLADSRLRLAHAVGALGRLRVRGYAELSHYYRAFTGRYGMSPGKWGIEGG